MASGRAAARGDNFVRMSDTPGPEKVIKRRKGIAFRIPLLKKYFKPELEGGCSGDPP